MLEPALHEMIQEALLRTIQAVTGRLGPFPQEFGEGVKKVFADGDELNIIILGMFLDRCIAEGSFIPLKEAFDRLCKEDLKNDG